MASRRKTKPNISDADKLRLKAERERRKQQAFHEYIHDTEGNIDQKKLAKVLKIVGVDSAAFDLPGTPKPQVMPARAAPKVSLVARSTGGPDHIYLVGVSCVGKTTIGARLAENLGMKFINFDSELERLAGKPIARLKAPFLGEYSFRTDAAAPILKKFIETNRDASYVLELPPSGVKDAYWRVLKKEDTAIIVAVCDRSTNIFKRIKFYDDDSNPIEVKLTKRELRLHLKDIQEDVEYFGRTYKRAHLRVDLDGADIEDSARMIQKALRALRRP